MVSFNFLDIMYYDYLLREAFKKKIKSVDFFHTAGGGQPQIHTFLKVWILSSFCGLEGHFQGEIEEKFPPPQNVFPHFREV